jgi:pullulanase/glycogen debranching enzyme
MVMGVNFAVFSAHAQAMELCLFDETGATRTGALATTDPHQRRVAWLFARRFARSDVRLRAHGPWRPDQGHRFNAS